MLTESLLGEVAYHMSRCMKRLARSTVLGLREIRIFQTSPGEMANAWTGSNPGYSHT